MADQVQISAYISADTKTRMERYVREHGVRRSYLVEKALQHYLAALEEVPVDIVIPPAIVVTQESGKRIAALLKKPPPPTDAMKALFDEST
jgi:hypothetical protein